MTSVTSVHDRFVTLYTREFGRLSHRLERILHGAGEDAAQEAFARAWGHYSDKVFPSPHHETAWLFRIGHNLAVDVLRANRRIHLASIEQDGGYDWLVAPPVEPDLGESVLAQVLRTLTPLQRQVIRNYYILGQPLGLADKSVMHRARQRLRRNTWLRQEAAEWGFACR